MATLPFLPSDAKSLISDPTATMCGNFLKTLLQLPIKFWQLVSFLFDSSGKPTKAFVNSVLPTGTLSFSAVSLPEDGTRLLCDGRPVSQTDYPDLYAALGTVYGGGLTVKLPDYRGRFPCGIGTFSPSNRSAALGTPGGEDKHLLTSVECGVADHTHDAHSQSQTGGNTGFSNPFFNGDGVTSGVTGGAKDATDAHENLPPYLPAYIYIAT